MIGLGLLYVYYSMLVMLLIVLGIYGAGYAIYTVIDWLKGGR
jgi:hypothetical protein